MTNQSLLKLCEAAATTIDFDLWHELVAAARTEVPRLIEENERLRTGLEEIAAMFEDWNSDRMRLVRQRARNALGAST